jgi:hypothetical protein
MATMLSGTETKIATDIFCTKNDPFPRHAMTYKRDVYYSGVHYQGRLTGMSFMRLAPGFTRGLA